MTTAMTVTADPTIELLANLHHITLARYHAMIEAGVLGEDDPVELLSGKIIDMSPVGRFHAVCVRKLNHFFVSRLADAYVCSQEQPITLPDDSEPEPDYVVATRHAHQYLEHHPYPEDIHLLVEVADRTLVRDRGAKRAIYARAGIPEYWIFNLIERQLECYTDPNTETGTYQQCRILAESETLEDHPIGGTVKVSDLLP